MDAFVRHFFPEFDEPGVGFQFGGWASTYTFVDLNFDVSIDKKTASRKLSSSQPMTIAGKMEASISTATPSFSGLPKAFLTPEGYVNKLTIAEALEMYGGSGMRTSDWSWADNHVTLLVNMLRYVFLSKFQSERSHLNITLGYFKDPPVEIDMDQFWDAAYPEACNFTAEWPGGNREEDYPDYEILTAAHPTSGDSAVDLRGLRESEARFVLLMLGAWRRRSRARLDFALPRLADAVLYRYDLDIANLNEWLVLEDDTPDEAADRPAMPACPSTEVAWRALRGYVAQNRLFDHFSVALYIVCCTAYQFLPVTAEGIYWLSIDWKLVLPAFQSIRGRYIVLNEGEAASISDRALNEWHYINGRLEKVNLMALVFVQAYQTGMAVRAMRKGMGGEGRDLYDTEDVFYRVKLLISAAAAEATRIEVPLSGMPGVYLWTDELFDEYDTAREVLTLLDYDADDLPSGYRVGASVVRGRTRLTIKCPWINMAGFPTLIVPLSPFPFNSPLSLQGNITQDLGTIIRSGFRVSNQALWLICSLEMACGYGTEYKVMGGAAGPSRCHSPQKIGFAWPMLFEPGMRRRTCLIRGRQQREHHFTELPIYHSELFKNTTVEYKYTATQRGTESGNGRFRSNVAEYRGCIEWAHHATWLPEYIFRDAHGFSYLSDPSLWTFDSESWCGSHCIS